MVIIIKKLFVGLEKTKKDILGKINSVIKSFKSIDDDLFEELEFVLISCDLGVYVSQNVITSLKNEAKAKKIREPEALIALLKSNLKTMLADPENTDIFKKNEQKKIILVVGVNGVGKTTSVAKIANVYKQRGYRPIIAAADTFRAAAVDQLQIWADRAGVKMISQNEGADPSSVIYDAVAHMKRHDNDVLICDTAGRLHNKKNLMNELKKIYTTIEKNSSDTQIYTLLVIDASTGQNGVSQAKLFKEAASADGIVLTKIDGTAKGGIVFPISYELGIPVKFVGVGEKIDDFEVFDPDEFINAMFNTNMTGDIYDQKRV